MREKFHAKGAWSGSRDTLKNFKPLSVFLEWIKLQSLNFASESTMASAAAGVKNFLAFLVLKYRYCHR